MTRIARFATAFVLGVGFLLPAAWAEVSRDQAIAVAQANSPGKVLAVEHGVHVDNKLVWRVRIATAAGELKLVVIDAETGRVR
jgi:uncharacterized membrane protein YkoI